MPTEPKKVEGKKRHKPPVVVLLVDQPFAAELFAKHKPQHGEEQNA